ncbi:hypothetical protein DNU06_11145 [Putridiphycobacter roseus]|uniref:DUF7793 domain-containing protein n=1 Tax=Putridiphycobacter roseus TaxID=2219161 RepID=A0A2W1NBV0_9FLAO|nr:hypothetical protein [Putridiphycobacter roseus]PZE16805.1 hypothetical protein DNU06_11145 [Putridiphycobacter roseus]
MDEYKSNKAVVSKFGNSIVLIEYKEDGTTCESDLVDIEKSVVTALGNQPYFSISVLPANFRHFNEEAKNFIIDENKCLKNRMMDTYVTNSFAKRIELELFFQLYKPTRKTKIFNSINKALTYLSNVKKLETENKNVLV